MKQLVLTLFFFTSILNCNGQKNNTFNYKEMKTFNIQKFEENKGKQGYANEYQYKLLDNSEIRELSSKAASDNFELHYQREITKEFNPFKYYSYFYANGNIVKEVFTFNNSVVETKEYDKKGNLIKETDFDKNFKHTFEQIHDFVLKEKKVDIYDTRQAVALRHDTPSATIKKYYQIHVLKSNLVEGKWYSSPNYSFIIDDNTGKIIKTSETTKK